MRMKEDEVIVLEPRIAGIIMGFSCMQTYGGWNLQFSQEFGRMKRHILRRFLRHQTIFYHFIMFKAIPILKGRRTKKGGRGLPCPPPKLPTKILSQLNFSVLFLDRKSVV